MCPVYEYECDNKKCKHQVVDLRSIHDAHDLVVCPICDKGLLRLQVSAHAKTPNLWTSPKP